MPRCWRRTSPRVRRPHPYDFAINVDVRRIRHAAFATGMADAVARLDLGALGHAAIGGDVHVKDRPAGLLVAVVVQLDADAQVILFCTHRGQRQNSFDSRFDTEL